MFSGIILGGANPLLPRAHGVLIDAAQKDEGLGAKQRLLMRFLNDRHASLYGDPQLELEGRGGLCVHRRRFNRTGCKCFRRIGALGLRCDRSAPNSLICGD